MVKGGARSKSVQKIISNINRETKRDNSREGSASLDPNNRFEIK